MRPYIRYTNISKTVKLLLITNCVYLTSHDPLQFQVKDYPFFRTLNTSPVSHSKKQTPEHLIVQNERVLTSHRTTSWQPQQY